MRWRTAGEDHQRLHAADVLAVGVFPPRGRRVLRLVEIWKRSRKIDRKFRGMAWANKRLVGLARASFPWPQIVRNTCLTPTDCRSTLIGCRLRPTVPARARARAFDVFVDCFQRGLLVRVTGDIVALSPPLIAEAHEFERTVSSIDQSLRSVA